MEFYLKIQAVVLLLICVTLSGAASAQQPPLEWNALQSIGNERDCPTRAMGTRWHVRVRNGRLVATSDGFARLRVNLRHLNADGSGRVSTITRNGRPAWFEFEPGHGPRAFHYHIGYHACIFMLAPT